MQMPVVASNRIGTETFEHSHITFYGGSFIAGPAGEIVAQVRRGRAWPNAKTDRKEKLMAPCRGWHLDTMHAPSCLPGPCRCWAQAGAHGAQANGGIDPEPEQDEGVVVATFDLEECSSNRAG